MRKYLFFAILGITRLFASCNKTMSEPQQVSADNTPIRVEDQGVTTRIPVTGWYYYGDQSHLFTGINGDDFYVYRVYSVRVTCFTAGTSGYVNLGSANQ